MENRMEKDMDSEIAKATLVGLYRDYYIGIHG